MTDFSKYAGTNVRIQDFRSCHFCVRGAKYGFERYGLDFNDFLANGVDGELLLTTTNGDAMVLQVVEVAYGRR